MSKLSFRARALDAGKPMPIFMAEELPDLPDYSAINRAVPQLPSGMEKEEECEHHLQRAICAGLIIPTPEVTHLPEKDFYDRIYPANYKQPRQLIHMQPFTMEQDIPDYDMDSEDERWLQSQTQRLDLNPLKFEEMMDRLEKSSGQTVVTLHEAKALLKDDDDLIIAVFDYWLNKRLTTQHPLILSVRTGSAANNPYLAFRRRTEKMQTRKNRKNDETSYEKMLKLRRDLHRAVTLLDLVKKREKMKREHCYLTVEVFEKRYYARDFSGAIYAEAATVVKARPAFQQIFHNHYTNHQGWSSQAGSKEELRKEKRQYKKKKHKASRAAQVEAASSDDETVTRPEMEQEDADAKLEEEEGEFAFRRNKLCSYQMPVRVEEGAWPWQGTDKRYRFALTSVGQPRRCVGLARRRVGRGGRVILDRAGGGGGGGGGDRDEFWRTLDFSIIEPKRVKVECAVNSGDRTESEEVDEVEVDELKADWLHFRPKTPPLIDIDDCGLLPEADNYLNLGANIFDNFAIEIQSMEVPPSTLLDTSLFQTDPFSFDTMEHLIANKEDVPVTDTRQTINSNTISSDNKNVQTGINLNVNVGLNTLTSRVNNENNFSNSNSCSKSVVFSNNDTNLSDSNYLIEAETNELYDRSSLFSNSISSSSAKSFGCSKFFVSDSCSTNHTPIDSCSFNNNNSKHKTEPMDYDEEITATTITSTRSNLKNNRLHSTNRTPANTNGLLSQLGHDGWTKNNKVYAYSGAVGYSNASSGTLSLHTSAHTLTLNSHTHSANILEIPIADDDAESVSNKLVNSQCAESGTSATSNKTKTIVRKSNLVMEVT